MKKFTAILVLVVIMAMATAYAEMMSFDDFCKATEIGDVIEQSDGTYKMVMTTINGYKIIITAPVYEALEGDVTIVCLDGYEWNEHLTMENVEEAMRTFMTWMYNDYIKGWA